MYTDNDRLLLTKVLMEPFRPWSQTMINHGVDGTIKTVGGHLKNFVNHGLLWLNDHEIPWKNMDVHGHTVTLF